MFSKHWMLLLSSSALPVGDASSLVPVLQLSAPLCAMETPGGIAM